MSWNKKELTDEEKTWDTEIVYINKLRNKIARLKSSSNVGPTVEVLHLKALTQTETPGISENPEYVARREGDSGYLYPHDNKYDDRPPEKILTDYIKSNS